jgi:hypothetical protein
MKVTHENKNTDFQVDGKWVLRTKGPEGFIQTRLGRLHNNITQRTKPEGAFQASHPTYAGVTLHPDWEDPQKFCDWVVAQKGWGEPDWALDKDLLVPGNKIYGPDTCCFLPREVNTAILPVAGLSIALPPNTLQTSWGCYYKGNDWSVTKRGFHSEAEARAYYKGLREGVTMSLARRYKRNLDPRAFEALSKWELIFK